jgi:peptidoglycan/xylan/chitin deacetylase (PgdA/CDA1 family)
LCYHSISEPSPTPDGDFAVRPAEFQEQMAWLATSGYRPLNVSRYAEMIRRNAVPERCVLVTFDDGFADFVGTALPILEAYEICVTLYMTVSRLDEAGPAGRMLSRDELRECAARGVEIGSHGYTHRELDTLRPREVRAETERSRQLLQELLGAAPASFAYPYGYNCASTRSAVRLAGYTSACGVKNSYSHPADDLWSLARILMRPGQSLDAFRNLVRGVAPVPLAPGRERLRTTGWRCVRRARRLAAGSAR